MGGVFFFHAGWWVWVFRVVMILFFIFLWGGRGSRGPIGGGRKGFFHSGVRVAKYFSLVVGGLGDTWISPKFCIF